MANNASDVSGIRVLVALTGRVDSAVAAFLLKKQGYDVIGLAMVVSAEDLTNQKDQLPSCYIDNLDYVKDICDKIGIPFYATDIKAEFDYEVVDTLVENKIAGFANSSCFKCTSLRMNTLFAKMKHLKAHKIATGHYCKVYENLNTNEYYIHSNNNIDADQSSMLAGLSQDVLKHLILPLGELRKEEVIKIAKNYNLVTSNSEEKEEEQLSKKIGFCFRTKEASQKILDSKVPKSMIHEGAMVNKESENIYGDHQGLIYHYFGQNELQTMNGVKLDKTLEVVDYDFKKHYLYIGQQKELTFSGTQVTNLITNKRLDKRKPLHCFIKFKYSDEYLTVHIYFKNNQTAYMEFEKPVYPLLPHEQMIIYDTNKRNSKVIGYGYVGERGAFKELNRLDEYNKKADENEEVIEATTFKF